MTTLETAYDQKCAEVYQLKAALALARDALEEPIGFTGSKDIDRKLRKALAAIDAVMKGKP